MTNLEIEGPLANLMKSKRVIKELGTTTPCPGSKYTELFQKKKPQHPTNPYIGEEEDE